MLRSASLTLLALVATATIWSQSATSAGSDAIAGAATIVNEPVVIWDTSGSVFAGTVHRNLVVYNSGFATISKRDENPFGTLAVDVQTASVGPDGATDLLLKLVGAGALGLPDQDITTADIPLKTLTLLEGKEVALSRTYSYWANLGQYAAVDAVVQSFIADNFPGF